MVDKVPELETQLCFALYAASRAVARTYAPVLEPFELTYPQYYVMLALWESHGGLTVGALGRKLHIDNGTLTPLIKRMETKGLVLRTRDPADERRVIVTVSAAGLRMKARAAGIQHRIKTCYQSDDATLIAVRDHLFAFVEVLSVAEDELAAAEDQHPARAVTA